MGNCHERGHPVKAPRRSCPAPAPVTTGQARLWVITSTLPLAAPNVGQLARRRKLRLHAGGSARALPLQLSPILCAAWALRGVIMPDLPPGPMTPPMVMGWRRP
jgi:hypothetical protein